MQCLSRGDVWYAEFPSSSRHEQAGRRPAIILADIPKVEMAVVVPLTKNLERAELPFTHVIAPSKENGLPEESVALIFQLRALDKTRFRDKLGVIGPRELTIIKSMIADMFGIRT
ncbi:type II toxin-antitoxin system PemK/MazF family toxin [Candidatus Micrarchaeota archaeon]|nr:MAG: type II toxin-antitoxin system PemK/MazF family toxin [Candidatus Micrarchaeota archaeon]